MDRMSAQDASFLYVEDENNPMHIGSVSIFEGPAPAYGDVVRMVMRKLPLVPRYRQRVRFVPFDLGRPVWVDDSHFQVLYHVRHTAVPRPGGPDQLRNLAGRVLAQHLDRSRPLWELWMVEGLEDDRWALVAKTHHCMVDGVAGTELLTLIFDQGPNAEAPEVLPWTPRPEPGDLQLLADAAVRGVRSPVDGVRGLPLLARVPIQDLGQAAETLYAVASTWLQPRRTPEFLNGSIGPHRRWSWTRTSLEDVKEIKSTLGGTVNDVVLAAITRGFRDLLLARGEQVRDTVVRTLVPVSVRTLEERGVVNNRVSGVFPDLPVGIDDPVERLAEIRRQMDDVKDKRHAVAGEVLVRMSGFAPPMWLALSTRLGAQLPHRLVQTVTTNVPGPQTPLYVMGRQMVRAYPYVPIGGHIRLTIAIFSYIGQMSFGVTGEFDAIPDVETLCKGIEEGVAELLAIARRRSRGQAGGRRRRAAATDGQQPQARRRAAPRGQVRGRARASSGGP